MLSHSITKSLRRIKTISTRTIYTPIFKSPISNMPQGTDKSHAVGDSIVPQVLQEKLPQKVEEKVPNAIHDTGSSADTTGNAGVSHATGDSVVPKVAQEAVPKQAEEVLPEKVHPTK